ncbi:hypothetical protein D9758_014684 [Tetrapyrgos nigripes]|uniref:Uncharacterized protein n=1 Tax=Tetrapyrgos nigripes TaxID=182062 RepID=A0A8H5CKV7_9AGAR|nr:hypothetical protein D9758_014684 [Tetrapyrgos nigripes]
MGWTNDEQYEYLNGLWDDYASAKTNNRLYKFWPDLTKNFFKRWPVVLTEAEIAQAGNSSTELLNTNIRATKYAKQQIKDWYRNRWKSRGGVTSDSQVTKHLLKAITSQGTSKHTRRLREEEAYGHLYNETDSQSQSPSSSIPTDEASLAVKSEPDLDSDALSSELSPSELMTIRRAVTKELYDSATPEVKALVSQHIEEDAARKQKEKTSQSGEDRTPEEYARAISGLAGLLRMFFNKVGVETGWSFTVLAGGPHPNKPDAKEVCVLWANTLANPSESPVKSEATSSSLSPKSPSKPPTSSFPQSQPISVAQLSGSPSKPPMSFPQSQPITIAQASESPANPPTSFPQSQPITIAQASESPANPPTSSFPPENPAPGIDLSFSGLYPFVKSHSFTDSFSDSPNGMAHPEIIGEMTQLLYGIDFDMAISPYAASTSAVTSSTPSGTSSMTTHLQHALWNVQRDSSTIVSMVTPIVSFGVVGPPSVTPTSSNLLSSSPESSSSTPSTQSAISFTFAPPNTASGLFPTTISSASLGGTQVSDQAPKLNEKTKGKKSARGGCQGPRGRGQGWGNGRG